MTQPRHAGPDRLIHWLIAAAMLTLLGTSLLPQMGVRFEWLLLHWVTGVLLTLFVLLHLVRVAMRGSGDAMWVPLAEAARYLQAVASELGGRPAAEEDDPGQKYALPQKLFHHAVALIVLSGVVTGVLLLFRIDTPFWERDPYWLSAAAWGTIYVLHDLVALLTIPALMLHLYFAARPEKRRFARAMIFGWMNVDEERS